MATFIVLGVILLILAFSVIRSARRQREQLEARRRREEELARSGGAQGPGSPFAGMPFGGLFDQLLTGPGSWGRSLEYDPETGQWVDVTDRAPSEEAPAPNGQKPAPEPAPRRTQAASPGPFGGLFGS